MERPALRNAARSGAWIWPALVLLLAIYVAAAWRATPAVTFGTLQDDTLYFSSAKALASGQGYILPNFPGRLSAAKYPELYPMLLAGVWKVDPHFPGNLNLAAALTLAFGVAALVVVFLTLRRWPGVGDWPALILTGLCAFTAYFLYMSVGVMSDVPFMAMTLGAACPTTSTASFRFRVGRENRRSIRANLLERSSEQRKPAPPRRPSMRVRLSAWARMPPQISREMAPGCEWARIRTRLTPAKITAEPPPSAGRAFPTRIESPSR